MWARIILHQRRVFSAAAAATATDVSSSSGQSHTIQRIGVIGAGQMVYFFLLHVFFLYLINSMDIPIQIVCKGYWYSPSRCTSRQKECYTA